MSAPALPPAARNDVLCHAGSLLPRHAPRALLSLREHARAVTAGTPSATRAALQALRAGPTPREASSTTARARTARPTLQTLSPSEHTRCCLLLHPAASTHVPPAAAAAACSCCCCCCHNDTRPASVLQDRRCVCLPPGSELGELPQRGPLVHAVPQSLEPGTTCWISPCYICACCRGSCAGQLLLPLRGWLPGVA